MKNEVWKDIKGYEGLYQVSNLGRIKSLEKFNKTNIFDESIGYTRKEKILKPYFRSNLKQYLVVCLYKNKKGKLFSVHRLVAENFIENKEKYKEVNHIDGNKTNNNVVNLEWCNRKQNSIHSVNNGLQKTMEVGQYDMNNNLIKIYFNARRAELETKIYHISDCCKNKRKTAGGYIWKHVIKRD